MLRDRAQRVADAADQHHAKTLELLAQVAKHEQVPDWSDAPAGQAVNEVTKSAGVLGMEPVRPLTRTQRLRGEAERLLKQADTVGRLAGADEIQDVKFDEALAWADPDGPEAERRAEAKARREREDAERKARQEREVAERRAMAAAFDQALVDAGQCRDLSVAHNVRVRSLRGQSTAEAFVDALAEQLASGPHDAEARAKAERIIAEARRDAGRVKA